LYSFQSVWNTSATTAATNTHPEVIECLKGHNSIKQLTWKWKKWNVCSWFVES